MTVWNAGEESEVMRRREKMIIKISYREGEREIKKGEREVKKGERDISRLQSLLKKRNGKGERGTRIEQRNKIK